MTNERVKTLPAKELDCFLSIEFFYEQTQETQISVQASNNLQFSVQNCPKWKEASNCYRERRGGLTSCFAMRKLKIFHAGSTETIFRISTSCSCWDLWQIPLQIVLEALFIFNTIYVHWICFQTRGSLFFLSCSRHQKRSPLNSSDRKCVLTEESMTPVPYNKLLTNLACSSRTGEYWPSRSVSKRLIFHFKNLLFWEYFIWLL